MPFRRFLFLFGLLLLIAITIFHISRARDFQLFGQLVTDDAATGTRSKSRMTG
jgi:hypothetical protein